MVSSVTLFSVFNDSVTADVPASVLGLMAFILWKRSAMFSATLNTVAGFVSDNFVTVSADGCTVDLTVESAFDDARGIASISVNGISVIALLTFVPSSISASSGLLGEAVTKILS